MNVTRAPMPTRAMAPLDRPLSIEATPAVVMTEPMTGRLSDVPVRSSATDRIAAIGGTLAALRAGKYADTRVTVVPTISDVRTLAGDRHVAGGQVEAERGQHRRQSGGKPTPVARPTTEATAPTATASTITERMTCRCWHRWPAATPSPAALGDDDREGVEDDERTDEQRDAAEDQQEGVEERRAVLGVVLGLLGDLVTGEDLDVLLTGERPLDVPDDLLFGYPGVRLTTISSTLPFASNTRFAGSGGEQHTGRAEEALGVAQFRDAHELVVTPSGWGDHRHRVAGLVVGVVGGGLVDHDLVGARAPRGSYPSRRGAMGSGPALAARESEVRCAPCPDEFSASFLSMTYANPDTVPAASATPSADRTTGNKDASMCPRPMSNVLSNCASARTTASVFL